MSKKNQNADENKKRASAWFEDLRDQICAEFEAIEKEYSGGLSDLPAGQFQ